MLFKGQKIMKKLYLISLVCIQPLTSLCNDDSTVTGFQKARFFLNQYEVAKKDTESTMKNYLLIPGLASGAGFLGIIATQGFNNSIASLWNNLDFKAQCAALVCLGVASTNMVKYYQAKQQINNARTVLDEGYKKILYSALDYLQGVKNLCDTIKASQATV
jgi:carbon starvation protein CstA